jgi:hypothetical protein
MTSSNICVTRRFKNATFMNTQCECGSDAHEHDLEVEYDEEFDRLVLHMYFKTWTLNPYKYHGGIRGWFVDLWSNIKIRGTVLFKGWVDMNYEFIFNGEEAVQDYINALQESLDQMKQEKAKVHHDKIDAA